MVDPTLPEKNPAFVDVQATKIGAEQDQGGSAIPPPRGDNAPTSLPPFPGGGGSTPPKKTGTI